MSKHYAYDLKQYGYPGPHHQPTFTSRVSHSPLVTIMDAYDADHNSGFPPETSLRSAKARAQEVRDNKIELSPMVMENTYTGVNYDELPESRQLVAEAKLGRDADTFFDDFLTAEFYRGSLRPNKRNADPTLPNTAPAMKLHVDLLVRAFKSTQRCDDNQGMIKPFVERRHDPKLVECLCWSLVKACIFRAKSDEPLLTAYEPHKAKNSVGLDTFDKRFNAIALTLSRSKTICKHLYDAPFINTFVDDPLKSIRRVDSNRDLNKQKADIMAQGKAALGQPPGKGKKSMVTKKRKIEELDFEDDEPIAGIRTPPPPRRVSAGVAGGRVTRRMSRLMAESDKSYPSVATPASSHSHSSPFSAGPVKHESSPLDDNGYNFSAYNGYAGYNTNAGNMNGGYDQSMLTGINNYAHAHNGFRYNAPTASSFFNGYPIAVNPYGNGMTSPGIGNGFNPIGLRNPFNGVSAATSGSHAARHVEEVSPTTRVAQVSSSLP
jgi:hypothetical protein